MNDEDVVMVDSVKRDVDRDIDHGGELVINANGIHLIEKANRCAAAILCNRLTIAARWRRESMELIKGPRRNDNAE